MAKKNKSNNCYEISALSTILQLDGAVLVHGIPLGQGKIEGIRFGHAWVELNNFVFDPVAGIVPRDEYYAVGRITYTKRYTLDDMLRNSAEYGTFGPWD